MKVCAVDNRKLQKRFLLFRKELYKSRKLYIDNNYFMLKEIFGGKLKFTEDLEIKPVMITDESGGILCEGVIAYTDDLKEYVQLCFFEAKKGCKEAVKMLVDEAVKVGKEHGCKKLVIGLYGHVNYGLGLQSSHYDESNSFSSPGNPSFYNDYLSDLGCELIKLNSYITYDLQNRLDRYRAIIDKFDRQYEFRVFDKKRFDYYSKIYTDLNNECFADHRYYYHRNYEHDKEMLKELFLFMKEDSIIFAFHEDEPVGFIMWYPDYNELANPGEIFGVIHYLRYKLNTRSIRTAKVMEYGVLKEYRGSGLPMALINKVYERMPDYGCTRVETSWILDENEDSNSFCRAICEKNYKDYAVYEKSI